MRAELRRSLLRLEVHVDQSEAVAVAINPFKVVLYAPEEVPAHWDALGSRTVELREIRAQEHNAIRVVHLAITGDRVRRGAAVLSDEDRPRAPQRLHVVGCPVETRRVEHVPFGLHLRMRR